jgi:hypothetical protein
VVSRSGRAKATIGKDREAGQASPAGRENGMGNLFDADKMIRPVPVVDRKPVSLATSAKV